MSKQPPVSGAFPPSPRDMSAIKERLELIAGQRGDPCDLQALENLAISNPPTQAEVELVRSQLVVLLRRLQA